jgi:hypothetical protein
MATTDILLACGFALLLLTTLLRPNQVVVRERNTPPGCIGTLLGIIFLLMVVIIGLILLGTSVRNSPLAPNGRNSYMPSYGGVEPLVYQAPPLREITRQDTFFNKAPLQTTDQPEADTPSQPEGGSNRDIYMPVITKLDIVLVKRFADFEQALRLQKHFSRWGMEIYEVPSDAHRYWSCVPVGSPEEGYEKIGQWNRNHRDFDHLELELRVTHLIIQ